MPSTPPKTILFLCTGNYYRSRFAEMWFNHLARRSGLPWHADSRGLNTSMNFLLPGVISPATVAALAARGVEAPAAHRDPIECAREDLDAFDRLIALKEAEHRPLMRARFPDWPGRIEYWNIHDIDQATPQVAIDELDQRIQRLVAELSAINPPFNG